LFFVGILLAISYFPLADIIRFDVFGKIDFLIYFCVSVITCSAIFLYTLLKKLIPKRRNKKSRFKPMLFYILLSAPTQEFLFRTFIYLSLEKLNILNVFTMAICSMLFFGYAHRMFKNTLLYKDSYSLGLVLGVAYYFSPNLILASIVHAIIGIYAYKKGIIQENSFITKIIPK
jgi:membrane protease YdiL (CAAX protease family)